MRSKVAEKSSAFQALADDFAMATTLMGGTKALRAAGEKYMPRFPQETKELHASRLKTATLFPAYKRTVQTLASKPFSKPITLSEDMDPEVAAWLDNVDMQGRNMGAFCVGLMEAALSHGLGGILAEYPEVDTSQTRTLAQEKALGARPYLVHIRAENFLGYKVAQGPNGWRLTQLRFMETVTEDDPDDQFCSVEVEQVRVLEPGKWATYRMTRSESTKTADWALFKEGVTSLTEIPFVPFYGEYIGFMTARPPLIELAHLNIKHWQSQSDQDTILHIARIPILTRVGAQSTFKDGEVVNESLVIGSGQCVDLPLNGSLAFVEHSGAAIGAGKVSLDDLKEEMRQAGAELLVLSEGPTTATEIATDNAIALCHLQRIVQGMEDALDQALIYMGAYKGITNVGEVDIFDDFAVSSMADADAQFLLSMAESSRLSDETLFKEVQRRGKIDGDIEWDEEKDRIDKQGPAAGSIEPSIPFGQQMQ